MAHAIDNLEAIDEGFRCEGVRRYRHPDTLAQGKQPCRAVREDRAAGVCEIVRVNRHRGLIHEYHRIAA